MNISGADRISISQSSPLVTIVTPAYNRAAYLDETIQSILSQDYPHLEYIVLDDGSTDDTRAVLARYAGRILWESHPNMGEAGTVNKGWRMAHGEYIATVNSDDPLLPGAVRAAVAFLEAHPQVVAVYPDWRFIDSQGRTIRDYSVPEYDYGRMAVRHDCLPGPATFFRRRALEQAGERDPSLRYTGDFDFWLRLGLVGPLARLPQTLATFRVHSGSASVALKGRAMAEEHLQLVRKLYARADLPPAVRRARREAFSWACRAAAQMCKDSQFYWAARGYVLKSIFYCPLCWLREPYIGSLGVLVLPGLLYRVLRTLRYGEERETGVVTGVPQR